MARTVEDLTLSADPVVSLTDEAHRVVGDAMAQEPDPEHLALWLEVRGVQAGAFAYDLYFQSASDVGDDDAVYRSGDLVVVVPSASVDRLRGARLEWSDEGPGGLVLVNPNTPAPEEAALGVPPEVLAAGIAGPVASRCGSSWTRPSTHPSPRTAGVPTWWPSTRTAAWPTCGCRGAARDAPCRG